MFDKIPFDLPLQFLPGLATGKIVRYGAILKDAGTGRILGHLQESALRNLCCLRHFRLRHHHCRLLHRS